MIADGNWIVLPYYSRVQSIGKLDTVDVHKSHHSQNVVFLLAQSLKGTFITIKLVSHLRKKKQDITAHFESFLRNWEVQLCSPRMLV